MKSTVLAVGFAVAAAVVLSRWLSRRTGLPYPVFLVVAGAAASFVPRVPEVRLDPQIVFLICLPPLVYHAGMITSPRELRANARPIALSALGLVLATTFAVAAPVWVLSGRVSWAAAFVLGAVVAPTDPVAATSVLKRLGAPRRVATILEGESLVNDGVALSLFAIGITALGGHIGVGGGVLAFLKVAGGGAAFGLVVGLVASRVRHPVRDAPSHIAVSLLLPYAAYLPADVLGLSGVLSTLVTGLVLSQQPVAALQPAARLQVSAFWELLIFLLESALFLLVGSQLRYLLSGLGGETPLEVVAVVAATVAAVVIARALWQLAIPTIRFREGGRLLDTGGITWRERVLLGWCGLRGAISLAAALSIPVTVSGRPYPGRNLAVFATFCVILATLVGQGTSLPWLLRRLRLVGSDAERREHALARRRLAEAAIRRIDEMAAGERVPDEVAEVLRGIYERRLEQARESEDGEPPPRAASTSALRDAQRQLLVLQHGMLRQLHRSSEISFSVMREIGRELDLEHASLER